ncbi:hypothetical protein FO519_005609 [Halicephalobus sp. NKZ332]|nr:hypothetical protein FO519_005609 [Halicephalobus sp. NKZ332]
MLLWLLVFLAELVLVSGNVISCGGFVETLNNAGRAGIRVRLLTLEGHQKYETECNPDNGYYMIPIYNKGEYKFQIVPPNGWIYEKDTVTINVDGQNDPCTKSEDINFKHVGFTVSGKVKSGELGGPRGFLLGLYSPDGKLVSKAVTNDDGEYSFNAVPGSYIVYNVDKEAQCIERGEVPVTVSNAPVVVRPDITVSGHLLTVKVTDESGKSLSGASISLFSKKKLNLGKSVSGDEEPVLTPVDGGFQYALKTNTQGLARFPCLPPDEYKLTPSLKTDDVQFSFNPTSSGFNMKSENGQVTFQAVGFSTSGQVLIGSHPVSGADVLLDGRKVAETGADGRFHLKDIKSNSHKLTAQKKNYIFDVHNVNLSPASPRIPDIRANKIDICGSMKVDKSLFSQASISIKSNSNQFTTSVDSQGSFCLAVPPGKYAVQARGIPPVTPDSYDVDVQKEPVLNLLFTQFKANVEVAVHCLESCEGHELTLTSSQGVTIRNSADSKVVFKDVSPGKYSLSIVSNVPSCWEQEKLDFQIEDKDVSGLSMKQTGYKVNVLCDYPVLLDYRHSSKSTVKNVVSLQNNEKSFCVPAVGSYKVTTKSCHQFPASEFEFSAPVADPIRLAPKKARVTVSASVPSSTNEKFQLIVKTSNNKEEVVDESSASSSEHGFSFYIDMENAGSTVQLIPKSKTFLFHPEALSFVFDGNCNEEKLKFTSEKGSFIEGSIVPPVEGVLVKATNNIKADAQVLSAETSKNGKYVIGPLSKISDYSVEAEKEGYKFTKTTENVFQAIKLSELRVSFVDSETKKALGEVLASISGAENYRSNQIIGESGTHNYIGLRPGEYYIVAVLQEYQFEKSPAKITVREGEVASITLEGKRFAWSVFGKVNYLNGKPVSQMRVEAVSEKCGNLQEDAFTDESGNYRIRGLKVDCEYRVSPKVTTNEYSIYPPYIKNIVQQRDRKGVDFIISTTKSTFELFGKLKFNDETGQPNSVKVSLKNKGSTIQTVDVQAPSKSFFFVNDSVTIGDVFTVFVEDVKTRRIYEAEKTITIKKARPLLDHGTLFVRFLKAVIFEGNENNQNDGNRRGRRN